MQIEYQQPAGPGYQPGACNIGPAEIASRRRSGIVAMGIALAIAIGLVVTHASPWLRILVFPALAGGIVSLEQARRHFCAAFGLAGIRNFGNAADRERVEGSAALAADRRAALTLFAYSIVIGAILTMAFIALPI